MRSSPEKIRPSIFSFFRSLVVEFVTCHVSLSSCGSSCTVNVHDFTKMGLPCAYGPVNCSGRREGGAVTKALMSVWIAVMTEMAVMMLWWSLVVISLIATMMIMMAVRKCFRTQTEPITQETTDVKDIDLKSFSFFFSQQPFCFAKIHDRRSERQRED